MRKFFDMNQSIIAAPIASLMLILTACASSIDEPDTPGPDTPMPMRFSAGSDSRALVSNDQLTGAGSKFRVWANYYTSEHPEAPINVFDGIEVESDGNGTWSYENPQFWFPTFTYSFRAIYPANLKKEDEYDYTPTYTPATATKQAALSISGFDATKGIDVLAATYGHTALATGNPTVALNFKHLLARIDIKAAIDPAVAADGQSVKITSIRLYGFNTKGNWTGTDATGSWTGTDDAGTATYPAVDYKDTVNPDGKELTTTSTSLLDGDKATLVIPQAVPATSRVEINYTDDSGSHTRLADLYSASATLAKGWEASNTYTYTFIIGPNEYILFSKPTVVDWIDASGGNYIIQ